ncbi:MAG: C40 family peptidase [Coriobacteriia bacterium]|nr:C40 family peptidase [Coriobacteriia bacterium]
MKYFNDSYRTTAFSTVTLLAVSLLCVALFAATLPAKTFAASTAAQIADARQKATAARAQQDRLANDLESASEDYSQAASNLQSTKSDIFVAENKLKVAQTNYDAAQLQLNNRAASIYKSEGLTMFDVILGASSFSELATRLGLMSLLSEQDSQLLSTIRASKSQLEYAKYDLDAKKKSQTETAQSLIEKKRTMEALYAEQQQELNSLNGTIKKLIAQQRADAEKAARAFGSLGSNRSVVGGRKFLGAGSLGQPHPGVVAEAEKYIGRPYHWGSSGGICKIHGGPAACFDCSGLTQYCYNSIGISIQRNSRAQYRDESSAFIPADRKDLLEPGDLLFFGYDANPNRIHHVTIYAGEGLMIHAPQTGMQVSETSLSLRSDYVGAVRP